MAVEDFGLAYLRLIALNLATIAHDVGGVHTSLAPPSPGLSSSAGTFSSTPASAPASLPTSASTAASTAAPTATRL
jgi:hypothetical protein